MRTTKISSGILISALLLMVTFILFLSSCSVNVNKEADGENKQVDIKTPLGGIHVGKNADVADVGLPIYPGARPKQKDSAENKDANVSISGFGFGLKVVALEYQSNDAPDKLIAYYRNELKKYGENILVCHTSGHFNVDMKYDHKSDSSSDLTCDSNGGKNVELKVGTKENQHIVAVEPEGNGSSFALVYVRTHGKDADI